MYAVYALNMYSVVVENDETFVYLVSESELKMDPNAKNATLSSKLEDVLFPIKELNLYRSDNEVADILYKKRSQKKNIKTFSPMIAKSSLITDDDDISPLRRVFANQRKSTSENAALISNSNEYGLLNRRVQFLNSSNIDSCGGMHTTLDSWQIWHRKKLQREQKKRRHALEKKWNINRKEFHIGFADKQLIVHDIKSNVQSNEWVNVKSSNTCIGVCDWILLAHPQIFKSKISSPRPELSHLNVDADSLGFGIGGYIGKYLCMKKFKILNKFLQDFQKIFSKKSENNFFAIFFSEQVFFLKIAHEEYAVHH